MCHFCQIHVQTNSFILEEQFRSETHQVHTEKTDKYIGKEQHLDTACHAEDPGTVRRTQALSVSVTALLYIVSNVNKIHKRAHFP